MTDKITESKTPTEQTNPTVGNKPTRPTSLHDVAEKQITSPTLSPISPNDTAAVINNNNNNNINKPARPTSLHGGGINLTKNSNNTANHQHQVFSSARPLSSTQSLRFKTKQATNSDQHQQSTNFKRRQSLPTTNNKTSNSTNLMVPGSPSTYSIDDPDFDLSSSSRRYQYNQYQLLLHC